MKDLAKPWGQPPSSSQFKQVDQHYNCLPGEWIVTLSSLSSLMLVFIPIPQPTTFCTVGENPPAQPAIAFGARSPQCYFIFRCCQEPFYRPLSLATIKPCLLSSLVSLRIWRPQTYFLNTINCFLILIIFLYTCTSCWISLSLISQVFSIPLRRRFSQLPNSLVQSR